MEYLIVACVLYAYFLGCEKHQSTDITTNVIILILAILWPIFVVMVLATFNKKLDAKLDIFLEWLDEKFDLDPRDK